MGDKQHIEEVNIIEIEEQAAANINQEESNIREQLIAHGTLLENHRQETEELRTAMEKAAQIKGKEDKVLEEIGTLKRTTNDIEEKVMEISKIAPSYADIATGPLVTHTTPTLGSKFAVIVTSDGTEDSEGELTTRIRGTLDARNTGIQIQNMRKIKDHRIVLRCDTKKEMDKTMTQLKKNNTLKVEEAKTKDPLIILKNLMTYNTDEDIKNALISQNAHILRDLTDDVKTATVRYRRRARNPLENHVVQQVSPRLWRCLTEAGRVYIDEQRVRVEDQSPLVQCSVRLAYGHGKKLCAEKAHTCHYCGGPHMASECPSKKIGEPQSCINCRRAKNGTDSHAVYSSACPVRMKWDALARTTTAYCREKNIL